MGTATQILWSGTATQIFRSGSSGALLVPRSGETTAIRFMPSQIAVVQTTGGSYAAPEYPVLSAESDEQEWSALLSIERKAARKRGIKPKTVAKALREVRYGM
jgi:hypothetical protein